MVEEYEVRVTLRYTTEHTWARVMADGTVRVGVSDYSQKMMRKIVFVELPKVGNEVKYMEPFGSIESIKSISDLYSPISGQVKEVNQRLIEDPNLINKDPYGTGWLIVVKPIKLEKELQNILSPGEYKKLIMSLKINSKEKRTQILTPSDVLMVTGFLAI